MIDISDVGFLHTCLPKYAKRNMCLHDARGPTHHVGAAARLQQQGVIFPNPKSVRPNRLTSLRCDEREVFIRRRTDDLDPQICLFTHDPDTADISCFDNGFQRAWCNLVIVEVPARDFTGCLPPVMDIVVAHSVDTW